MWINNFAILKTTNPYAIIIKSNEFLERAACKYLFEKYPDDYA